MPIIIIDEAESSVVDFRGEAIGIVRLCGGGGGAEGGVAVMNSTSLNIHEIGDIFVAIVEVVSNIVRDWAENQWSGGDGFGGIPGVGVIEGVVGATELLDAEVVVVDEALEGFCTILYRAHFDTAAHTVKGHGDHGVAGLPTDGAVFGIVGDRPNAGFGLDEGLISYLTHTHGHMYSDIAVEHQRQKSSGLISSISIHLSRSIQLVKYNSISSFLSQIARKRENSSKPLASSLIWRKTCST